MPKNKVHIHTTFLEIAKIAKMHLHITFRMSTKFF